MAVRVRDGSASLPVHWEVERTPDVWVRLLGQPGTFGLAQQQGVGVR